MVVSNDPHRFEFDLDRGIQEQVIEKLEASPLLDLTKGVGPPASGIYALYFGGDLVYVGKASTSRTTSGRTLRQRLSEHRIKISKRRNITLDEMQCRYESVREAKAPPVVKLAFEFLVLTTEWWRLPVDFQLEPDLPAQEYRVFRPHCAVLPSTEFKAGAKALAGGKLQAEAHGAAVLASGVRGDVGVPEPVGAKAEANFRHEALLPGDSGPVHEAAGALLRPQVLYAALSGPPT